MEKTKINYIKEAKDILVNYSEAAYKYHNNSGCNYDQLREEFEKVVELIALGLENQDKKNAE